MKTDLDSNKILFVSPPCHSGLVEVSGSWIPLGLVYLAGAARQAGLEPEIYDVVAKGDDNAQIERRLSMSGASYIAVGASTATIDDAIGILDLARRRLPGCVTILGGVHPTFMYEEVLSSYDFVDYVVIGEGEATLQQLLEVLQAGGDPATVDGLAFRRSGKVVTTGRRTLIEDLDGLTPAWDLLDWEYYTCLAIPDSRMGAVSTSRGCSQDCAFCSQQRLWERSWRSRDPQKVADELEYLYNTYKVNVVMIIDEHPTRDRGRWEAILDAIIAKKLPVHLLMETRAEDIIRDREIIGKYRAAGIIYISCGVETAGQAALSVRVAKTGAAETKQAFDLLRDNEIVSEGSFMIGLPDETPESIKETLTLAREINPDVANFLTFTPWPYADVFASLAPLVRVHDYRKYSMVDTIIKPHHMSILQVDVAVADCYRRFYMGKIIDYMTLKAGPRRDYLMGVTKQFMGSSFVLRKLGVGLFGAIPAKIDEMKSGNK